MNEEEFVKEFNEKKREIRDEYKHPSHRYIKVSNKGGGYILAHEYIFAHDDFVLFAVWVNSKLVYVGGERLKNIKELSIMFGWG